MAKTIRYSRDGVCIIDGCDKKRYVRGMCSMHNARFERHGDPLHRQRTDRVAELRKGIEAKSGDECVDVVFQEGRRPGIEYRGVSTPASRYVWTIVNGDPGDLWVLHSCGRGEHGCVNIHHLYLGDAKRNSQDRKLHGTTSDGEGSGTSKLTDSQVLEIRNRYKPGRVDRGGNARLLADEFGVEYMTIWCIATRRTWKHI